ncbi:MAG: hypothetical protein M3O36_10690 [Myxococcota bacterium]|nr:hypothetical protein [Myxococcota bacterium]
MRARLMLAAPLRLVLPCLLLPALASAAEAGAEGAVARTAYDAGAKAYSERRFSDAARLFEEAANLVPNSVALYTAAMAWERAGESTRSADDFGRALALGGLSAQEAAKATERLALLERSLGAVHVVGPASAQVHLDNLDRGASVPVTLHGAAGEHTLVALASGEGRPLVERRTVSLEAGTTLEVELRFTSPPEPSAIAPAGSVTLPPNEGASRKRFSVLPALGVALVGAGAAAEIAAALLWSAAVGAGNRYGQNPTQAAYDRANKLESWTNVALVGGGVLAATGVACLLWPAGRASGGHGRVTRGPWREGSMALRIGPTFMGMVGAW